VYVGVWLVVWLVDGMVRICWCMVGSLATVGSVAHVGVWLVVWLVDGVVGICWCMVGSLATVGSLAQGWFM
jgi:hypothetical protein